MAVPAVSTISPEAAALPARVTAEAAAEPASDTADLPNSREAITRGAHFLLNPTPFLEHLV